MLPLVRRLMNRAGSSMLGKKGGFYRKSLIWILVISAIPGILTGACMYGLTEGRIGAELQRLHHNQIQSRASSLDDQLTYLELSLSHWAFDPKFSNGLSHKDFVTDFQDSLDISKTVSVMQGAHPFAKRVELYVHGNAPIVFSPEYNVLSNPAQAAKYNELAVQPKNVYWINWSPDPKYPDKKELVLVHKIPGSGAQTDSLIVVFIDRAKLVRNLKTLTPYEEGDTFILSEDDSFLLTSNDNGQPSPFEAAMKKKVLERMNGQGSFEFDWNHKVYTVSYGNFSRPGSSRTYVSAAPVSAITAPVILLSKLVIAVSLAALLLAAVLALIASHRIYSPVGRLVRVFSGGSGHAELEHLEDEFGLIERHWKQLDRESQTLRGRLEDQRAHVRHGFLLQLIQGYLYAYTEDDLLKRMRQYGWQVDNLQFVVLCVKLGGMNRLKGRFEHGDEGLLTFAAANIIEELAKSEPDELSVINFHDLSVGVLIMMPDAVSYKQELHALCEKIIQAVGQILGMQITVTISRSARLITEIPSLFEQARGAVAYRSLNHQNQIVDMERLETTEDDGDPHYPFGVEREIIQRMRSGQQEETSQLIETFLRELIAGGAKEIDLQQGMLQLLGSILHAITHSGISPKRVYNGANMFEQLAQIREPEQMVDWFRSRVIAPYTRELESRSDCEAKKVVENVMVFIQNNYMKDISLDQCADLSGTTAYYLSKTFKQVTGKNFIDYLTELRMDKAKDLLRETELKINDVSGRVGYQHTYFNRIFKKQEGVTPSQYRELSRRLSS